jgi:hypothetical protein
MNALFRTSTAIAALSGAILCGASLRSASAATGSAFVSTANPGGGSILTGTLGNATLSAATAALLRQVHTKLGSRPTVVQVAQNARDHSVALLFTATRNGTPYTGVAIVTAAPGAQAGGAVLYDTAARFSATVGPMMRRLQGMTEPASAAAAPIRTAPAEPLITRPFSDGTGSIGIPADWKLGVAGGGSASANGPTGDQVSYNMHFSAFDPSNPRAEMYLRTETPLARQNLKACVLSYISDPAKAWVAMYAEIAKEQHVTIPAMHVTSTSTSGATSTIIGTAGSGSKMLHFLAYVFVLPPNPNGLWSISDSHVFVGDAQFAQQVATATAVLNSVRINFGAVNAQAASIRQMYQKQFESQIANDRAQDAARAEGTDEALANDRAAQEGMHQQAVSMENYSLDRAVVVNTTTGAHSTVGSNFADTLVQGNPNYQKVPAAGLLRGVDY